MALTYIEFAMLNNYAFGFSCIYNWENNCGRFISYASTRGDADVFLNRIHYRLQARRIFRLVDFAKREFQLVHFIINLHN